MTSKRTRGAASFSTAGGGSGDVFAAVKAEEASRQGRGNVNFPVSGPGGGAVLVDRASEEPPMDEGARVSGSSAGRHEFFRPSRLIKVEALESRRVELSQTSASAEDAKSPANNDLRSSRPVTETALPSHDTVGPVKYEWQDNRRPRVCPLPAETDVHVVELVVVADGTPPTSLVASGQAGPHSIDQVQEDRRLDSSSNSLRRDEPSGNTGNASLRKSDVRTSSCKESGADRAGSSSGVPATGDSTVQEGSGEAVDEHESGGGAAGGLEFHEPSAAGEAETWGTRLESDSGPAETSAPAVPPPSAKATSVSRTAQSQGIRVPPADMFPSQGRALQHDGRGQSLVETLHSLRSFQKKEPGTSIFMKDDKMSVVLSGVKQSEAFFGDRDDHFPAAAFGESRLCAALPDLNEGGPTATAVKLCLDEQQEEQLRAQILVYGALIHGNQIDESLMESAFGDGISAQNRSASGKSEGKTLWEVSWRTREVVYSQLQQAEGTSERVDMADGIHVEVVASPDEVPDSPMSSESPALPGIVLNEDEAPNVPPRLTSMPTLEVADENANRISPVSSELLHIAEAVARACPMMVDRLFTPAAQDNVLEVVESASVQVERLVDSSPSQLLDRTDGCEMHEAVGLDVIRSTAENLSGVEGQPSHARRCPLTAVGKQIDETGAGTVSLTPTTADNISMTNLERNVSDAGRKQSGAACGMSHVVPRPVEVAEALHDQGTVSAAGPAGATVQHDGAQEAADLAQEDPPGTAVRSEPTRIDPVSSHIEQPIPEHRHDTVDRDGVREGVLSQLDQARISAEEAAADAASAVQRSQAVWTRVHTSQEGLNVGKQQRLASAAASAAAAASVAKANAAIAKLALEAASQAKLAADESTERVLPSAAAVGQGVLHAAKEQTLKRAEDAAAASKRAHLLNAIARAAELATEAAQQIGAVIAMGDPLRFSMQELDQAGINGHWKLGLKLENAVDRNGPVKSKARKAAKRKSPGNPSQSAKPVKNNELTASTLKAAPRKGSTSVKKKKEGSELRSGLKVVKKSKPVTVRLKSRSKPAPGAELGSSAKSLGALSPKSVSKPKVPRPVQEGPSSKSPQRKPSASMSKSTRAREVNAVDLEHDGSITEGSVVEVLADEEGLQGAWFAGKVLRIQGVEALVVYDEILADDGTTPLQEWVPLGAPGATAPKIRLAHPNDLSKNEGAKKRRRGGAGVGNRVWVVGEKVDAWIRDGWWEGRVEAVNNEDETRVTVHFPGEGDTSVIKSCDLRPSRVWRDGNWVLASELQAGKDEPLAKRPKVAGRPSTTLSSKGKEMKTVSAGGKGGGQVKGTVLPKKRVLESEKQLKGKGGAQDGLKSTKKRKLVEISEGGVADNVTGFTGSKQKPGKSDLEQRELSAEREKGGTATEKHALRTSTKSKPPTNEHQTLVARTRRGGGHQAAESGPTTEVGVKAPKQGSGGPGKASMPAKSRKQRPGDQVRASTPAKSPSKGKKKRASQKKPAKRTTGKEAVLEKNTSAPNEGVPTEDLQGSQPAKETYQSMGATKNALPPKDGPVVAKAAALAKSASVVVKSTATEKGVGVSSTRASLAVNDVSLESNLPFAMNATAPTESAADEHLTPGKDGRRGSRNKSDAPSSTKKQKTQKGGKDRRTSELDRRKSSRKTQPPPKL